MRSLKCPGLGPGPIERETDMDRSILRAALSATAVAAATLTMFASQAWATAKNVNFRGTWQTSNGQPVHHQEGKSHDRRLLGHDFAFEAGVYRLVACHVKGNHYAFTITYGASYKSYRQGHGSPRTTSPAASTTPTAPAGTYSAVRT